MSLSFVDTHVHFWDNARIPHPWLVEVPDIAGVHTPTELISEAGRRVPQPIVFVEASADPSQGLAEVRWVEELAVRNARQLVIGAIVAFAAVDQGVETETALDALRARPLVRGIRQLIQGEADPRFCLRNAFVAGVQSVGARGLSFDLCVKPPQLASVIELVRLCPQTSFILDHGGKPDIRRGVLDPWRAHIAELARLPNVVCKLSGLVTEADPASWTPAQLRPFVDQLLATFGPGRLMFGSDWPVVKQAASYQRWLDAALGFIEPLSPADRDAILSGNARRVYRLS
ncbi:MAG TPA: amidohydrolase family protein [Polyangia bacterium]|jgi:L-fuconolactonase|nr:amidohydrolase family protein [Polyangia bacterium]